MPAPRTVDQPGDHACRIPTDTEHRQGCCRYACGAATIGPSDSDCNEDSANPAGGVRRQSCGGACDHADAPVPPVAAKNTLQERISERTQIVDVLEPQTLEELVEAIQLALSERTSDSWPQFEDRTVEVVKTIPQERISKRRSRADHRRAAAARREGAATRRAV